MDITHRIWMLQLRVASRLERFQGIELFSNSPIALSASKRCTTDELDRPNIDFDFEY